MCMVNVLTSLLFVLLHLKLLPLTCIFQIEARHLHHSSVKNVHRNYITTPTTTTAATTTATSSSSASVTTESQFMINDGQVVSSDESSINAEQVNCNYNENDDDTFDLPAPSDISVVLASWTPPSIRVSWTFPYLNDSSAAFAYSSKTKSGRNLNFQGDESKIHLTSNYTPSPRPHPHPSSSPHIHSSKRLNHHHLSNEFKSDSTANSKVDYLHSNYNSNQLLNQQPRVLETQIITHEHLSSYNEINDQLHQEQEQEQKLQQQHPHQHQQQLINCTSGLTTNDLQTSNDQENSSNITRTTSKMDISASSSSSSYSSTNKSKCQSSGLINSLAKLEAFRIIYHPIKTRFRMIREVSPLTRNVTIDGLEPNVNYELVVIALFESPLNASIPPISKPLSSLQTSTPNYPKELYKFYHQQNKNKQTNSIKPRESASESIRFISPDIEPGRFNRHSRKPLVLGKRDPNEKVTIKTDELVIVILVLCVWCGVICLFIKKWGKIRAIEPCQSYFSPEIYDIPLKKSTMNGGGGSNGDLSNAPNGHDSSQLCQSTTGDGMTGVASAGGTFMASTESRRSLTTSMTIAAAAAATMAANASITGGHRRDSYPRFLGSPSPSSLYLTVHRPRINSVFVTPPTRPPTPLPMTINYSPGSSQLQQQQLQLQQLQQQQLQQSTGHPCANVKHIESPSGAGDSSANGSSSIPRRFKSAEDLRSIVNEFTRRKSTLLMSASYFQQQQQQQHLLQQQQSRSAHGSSHQQQSILERETSIPSTSSSPSYSQQQQHQSQQQQQQQHQHQQQQQQQQSVDSDSQYLL